VPNAQPVHADALLAPLVLDAKPGGQNAHADGDVRAVASL
jgi:hypothetical protein